MKVEREGDRIRIYSDVDKMLPLISMKLEVARKLYSELGEALATSIEYAYKTIGEYESLVDCKVNSAFETGWIMSRTTMGDLRQIAENSGGKMVDDEPPGG